MEVKNLKTLKDLFNLSTTDYSKNKSFCDTGGNYYTYGEFGSRTREISEMLYRYGIGYGDKVGIYSQNMPNWPIAFFSCVNEGRIAVPMLPDFSENEISNIVSHSECKAVFISEKLSCKLNEESRRKISLIIEIDTMKVIKSPEKETPVSADDRKEVSETDLASIIYTSGTTGNSKGVMLTHKNLTSHLYAASILRPSYEWDVWLSLLPLSHTLECSLGMLLPMTAGASVYFIDKAPTPTVLMKALKEVRPTTVLSVPLIIEKIYRNAVLPQFSKSTTVKKLYSTVIGRKIFNRLAGVKLRKTFGGRLRFFGIGGAKLDGEVERFLLESGFPYAIGYGLTETSPLLAGANPKMVKWQSTGPAVHGVQLKINNPDPVTGEGEIWAKGPNVMTGYYKNPQATKEAFSEDGWFRTKDLGVIDRKGRLYIRGRLSNMILGASGENIYPEEIETVINGHEAVAESLVTEKKGRLVALVHFNQEKLAAVKELVEKEKKAYQKKKLELIASYEEKINEFKTHYKGKKEEFKQAYDKKRKEYFDIYAGQREILANNYNERKTEAMKAVNEKIEQMKEDVRQYVNSRVNKFSRIAVIVEQPNQFEKTATHKIKRYLYK